MEAIKRAVLAQLGLMDLRSLGVRQFTDRGSNPVIQIAASIVDGDGVEQELDIEIRSKDVT